jgi:hypothetical protein
MAFDYSLDYKSINFRKHPELYRVGRGEQGVLLVLRPPNGGRPIAAFPHLRQRYFF